MCLAKLQFAATFMCSYSINHTNWAGWKMWSVPSVESAHCGGKCGVWKMWRAENAERIVDHSIFGWRVYYCLPDNELLQFNSEYFAMMSFRENFKL